MIYLDHASTTYIYPEVIDVIKNSLNNNWGNPSSLYNLGKNSKEKIQEARISIANSIGAKPQEIIFSSGASEGNAFIAHQSPKILCSPYEHHNFITNPKCILIDENYLDLAIKKEIDQDYKLGTYNNWICSWMYVNNETGEIFDIKKIGEKAHKLGMFFHSDMTQALGNIPINVKELNVDYATFSGHKVHAPKGIGFIYINSETIEKTLPLIYGGGQEFNIRAGTENIAYIEGLRLAVINSCSKIHFKTAHTYKLKKYAQKLMEEYFNKEDYIIVSPGNSVNNIFCFCLKNISGEIITDILNQKQICISNGSACNSGNLEPSSVLEAMQIPEDYIYGEIRLSFDLTNTKNEIKIVLEEISKAYKELSS